MKPMRVLLISANTEQINMPVLPLGLACVAEATKAAGHDVKLINLMAAKDTRMVLKKALEDFDPEIIGISVRNIDDQGMENPRFLLESVKGVVFNCRDLSDAPIVLGGAGYSIFPQSSLAYLGADMGIQGEGERAFVILLDRLSNKADLKGVPGLYLSDRGLQGKATFIKNLDECPLPPPNVHLWSSSTLNEKEIWIPFQTRRGCSMNCSYCSTATIEGRTLRKHTPEFIVEAISEYVEAGFEHFFFVDNTFNLSPSFAKAFCNNIIKAGLKISWRCILYPWKVDENLVEKMARAGCKDVSLGFESGSGEILRAMGKKFQPGEVREISNRLKKHGIRRMGFLLLGGPCESKNSVEKSLRFSDSLGLETMKITIGIRIYPYTSLARTAVSEGLIEPDEDLLYPKFYMTKGLEGWLRKTVGSWMEERPNWLN